MPTTIRVALGERSYDIEIGRGNLAAAGEFVGRRLRVSRAVVITDSQVRSPHAERVAELLAASGKAASVLAVPAGEASKSVAEAERLWTELARL